MTKFQIHDQQPSQQNKKKWLYVGKFLLQQSISLSDCFARKKIIHFWIANEQSLLQIKTRKKKIKWNIFYDATTTRNRKKNTFSVYFSLFFFGRSLTTATTYMLTKQTRTFKKQTITWYKKKLTQTEYFLLPGRSFSLFFSFYTSTGFPCQKWCMSCHLF